MTAATSERPKLRRGSKVMGVLTLAIASLVLGETLLVRWFVFAISGGGFSATSTILTAFVLTAANVVLYPMARRRLHATGLDLFLSRVWILGSVAALLTGVLLGLALLTVESGNWLLGLVGLAGDTSRLIFWTGGGAVAAGFGAIFWGATVGNARVVVDSLELPVRDQFEELGDLRIAHITDLHIGPLMRPQRLRRLVSRINSLGADVIVITGDIFDFDPSYIDSGCHELAGLSAPLGVFAVLGNHDLYTGSEEVARGLRATGRIRLLRNEWTRIDVGGRHLVLAGLEDPGANWSDHDCESLELDRLAGEVPAGEPCVLLAHRPSYFANAARVGFSLVLVGHTHGGQLALPIAVNHNPARVISRWTRGVFRLGDSTMYVNRGLGMAGLPLRLNCPREIALIKLIRAD